MTQFIQIEPFYTKFEEISADFCAFLEKKEQMMNQLTDLRDEETVLGSKFDNPRQTLRNQSLKMQTHQRSLAMAQMVLTAQAQMVWEQTVA